jgi:hypothetical protein
MRTTLILAASLSAAALSAAMPAFAAPLSRGEAVPYERQRAEQEEGLVLTAPFANVNNDYWYNYETDVREARHELAKDLAGASDSEDERDAWDEYRQELADARHDYAKEMREKGYPVGAVYMRE